MICRQKITSFKYIKGLFYRKQALVLWAFLMFLVCTSFKLSASDWTSIVDLRGYWNFSVGDDNAWADPGYNDADWDRIYVPKRWEIFYPGYNGFAWYRKTFNVRQMPGNLNLVLMLGRIDDVDEVFLNGVKIGQSGSFFPHFKSAYNVTRKYNIPQGVLKKENNVIAIRVLDVGREGGIVAGNKIGIYYDNDVALLSYNLSGDWKFSTYRQKGVIEPGFDDSEWSTIQVPGYWEDKGFKNYDGYAWYRKTFSLLQEPTATDMYLILGRIDDVDKVYLNGQLVGRTEYLEKYRSYKKEDAWRLYRVYKIPRGLLHKENVLVIEVNDWTGNGGIYEGPVGLASYRGAQLIKERNDGIGHNNFIEGIRKLFDID